MKFWDSSAILSLISPARDSSSMLELLKEDQRVVVWTMTPTECLSALYTHFRNITPQRQVELKSAVTRLKQLEGSWIEVQQVAWVKKRAERLLAVHALSTQGALQLAAALVMCEDRPDELPFVTFDEHLARCAIREGFQVFGFKE